MRSFQFALLLSITLFSFNSLYSQDLIFSNYNNAPLYLNPALTGNFNEKARINYNFRNLDAPSLISNKYRYTTLSFDSKINLGKNQLGFGASANLDKIGNETNFGTDQINIHSAYIFNIGDQEKKHHSISVGGSFAYGAIGPIGDKSGFTDFSTGAVWKYYKKPRFNVELGSSIFHVNNPEISLSNGITTSIIERFNIHGRVEFPISKRVSLLPNFLFVSQGPHEKLIFGSEAKIILGNTNVDQYPFIKFGAFGNSATRYTSNQEFQSYIASSTYENRNIKLGLTFEKYLSSESIGLEFMAGLKLR